MRKSSMLILILKKKYFLRLIKKFIYDIKVKYENFSLNPGVK